MKHGQEDQPATWCTFGASRNQSKEAVVAFVSNVAFPSQICSLLG